jgi:hypothetical protein
MKTLISNSTNWFVALFALITTISFSSCGSAEGDSIIDEKIPLSTDVPFYVTLKAYSGSEDITSQGRVENATLYVFDENENYYTQITVDKSYLLQAKPIAISCPNSKKITVAVWSGVSSDKENISAMNKSNIINDLKVSVNNENGIATNQPSDMFYGKTVIYKNATTKAETQEIKIESKVASMTILTKNVAISSNDANATYTYRIKSTKCTFNSNGELAGNDIEFVVPAKVGDKGCVVSGTFFIIPSSNITIELVKNGNIILSSKNLQNTENVSVNAGEKTIATFDYTSQSSNLYVANWNSVSQIVEIG